MAFARLKANAPTLVDAIESTSKAGRRKIAIAVAALAIERVGLSSEAITEAMAALTSGAVGDTPARARVVEFAESLDNKYFELQEGRLTHDETAPYMKVFSQARAASALACALYANSEKAALEATYEAIIALDDVSEIEALVLRITRTSS
jgi:hypothetical protein